MPVAARALVGVILAIQTFAALAADKSSVPLTVRADRLFLPIEVNGQRTEALLDSAAESSLIDPSLVRELKLNVSGQATARGSGGQQEAQFAQVSVRAASVRMKDLTVAVVDLSDISRRLVGSQVKFILGRELLDGARLRIDIDGASLQVLTRAEPVNGVALALTDHAGIESIPVRVEGIAAAADVDLGNGSDVLIGKSFAERNGLLAPGRVIATRSGSGIGGKRQRELVRLSTQDHAGSTFKHAQPPV